MRRIVFAAVVCAGILIATGAGAAQIVQPANRPFAVALGANGGPAAFTVVATGFAPRAPTPRAARPKPSLQPPRRRDRADRSRSRASPRS